MSASHDFEQHTGEVQVHLEAESVPELFTEAANALCELLGTAADEPGDSWQRVTVTGRDRDALLVAWLNELIARTEIDHLLFRDVAVEDITAQRLHARIRGVPFAETRTAVKAATLHRLHIETAPGVARATLILDV